jgi:dihydroxyacetone kinase-like protein
VTITHDAIEDWMKRFAADVAENRAYLTKLDGAIGDGDHGTNMDRGMKKALERLEATDGDDIGASLKTVGMALVSSVGGAAGPLYGTLFLQMGTAAAGKNELGPDDWTAALEAGIKGVEARGKAEPGDKTMLDALLPGLEALRSSLDGGSSFEDALTASAEAAGQGMRDTIPLVAKKGRASYLGERSAGHQDPGATSSTMLLETAAATWGGRGDAESPSEGGTNG